MTTLGEQEVTEAYPKNTIDHEEVALVAIPEPPNAASPDAAKPAISSHGRIRTAGMVTLLASIVLTVLAAFLGRPWSWLAWLSNGVILLYGGWTLPWYRQSVALSARIGENAYFIGYLTTIAGLCGIAFEIGHDPDLLKVINLPTVLAKGAMALVTTISGLVVMNLLKQHAQTLELEEEHRGTKEADVVTQLLEKFAEKMIESERTRDDNLAKLFESSKLGAHMQGLAANLKSGADSLGTLQSTANDANQTLTKLGQHMSALEASVTKFNAVTESLAPAWKQISGDIGKATGLNEAVSQMTTSMQGFSTAMTEGQTKTREFTESAVELQTGVLNSIRISGEQLRTIAPLGPSVGQFVELAGKVTPMLHALGENFGKLDDIHKSFQSFHKTLQETNDQFVKAAGGAQSMSTTSREFAAANADLVAQLRTEVVTLKNLSEPLNQFGQACADMTPRLDTIRANIGALDQFTASVGQMREAANGFNSALTSSAQLAHELRRAIDDFASLKAKLGASASEPKPTGWKA